VNDGWREEGKKERCKMEYVNNMRYIYFAKNIKKKN